MFHEMLNKVTVLAFLVGLAVAFPTDPYAPPVHYKSVPIPYNYAYGVRDNYHGTDFGHNEDSDGKAVKGSYTVQLPDGRRQTVNYIADHFNGFQAEVSYLGEAQYPHEYGPPITFKPQSSYH
ncbi:cuticle protein 19-like [Macrobrachium nipponense]|uniref:cuticle protein 19-like n=1 Tax=Macrobrachium nipponense TaxID=159736 RepID=UPI0030C803AF